MKLSDTQLVILNAACQRDDRLVLPLPDRLKGGAAAKVIDSLVAKGLVEEVDAKRGDLIWRKTGDGHGVTLVVTDAALAALGIEQDARPPKLVVAPVLPTMLIEGTARLPIKKGSPRRSKRKARPASSAHRAKTASRRN